MVCQVLTLILMRSESSQSDPWYLAYERFLAVYLCCSQQLLLHQDTVLLFPYFLEIQINTLGPYNQGFHLFLRQVVFDFSFPTHHPSSSSSCRAHFFLVLCAEGVVYQVTSRRNGAVKSQQVHACDRTSITVTDRALGLSTLSSLKTAGMFPPPPSSDIWWLCSKFGKTGTGRIKENNPVVVCMSGYTNSCNQHDPEEGCNIVL